MLEIQAALNAKSERSHRVRWVRLKPTADGQEAGELSTRLVGLLRGQSNALGVCKPLKLGYAADFGRWCGSNGSRDERDFAKFANGM